MKKVIIGGILALCGTIGITVLCAVSAAVPISCWVTPPGRILCTILENGTAVPLLGFCILLAAGMVVLGTEYFKNDV